MKRSVINLTIALRSLLSFKLRTTLAVLGVILGTFSLIVVNNLSGSLAKKAQLEVDRLGKDLLIVRSGVVQRFGRGTRYISQEPNFRLGDIEAIANGASSVKAISPASSKTFPVRYKGVVLPAVLVTGVIPNYSAVRSFAVQEGIFITELDNKEQRNVVVLGSRVAEKCFGTEDPMGQYIMLWRFPCQVIGVMEEKGTDLSGLDQDTQVFVPLNTFLHRLVNREFIEAIYVQCLGNQVLDRTKREVEEILRIRHSISNEKKDDFYVVSMKDVTELQTQAMDMIKTLGRTSAVISFLIGSIGILSIMMLIVNERRMEIGIRRAVGSRRRDIGWQFLIESSLIALSGGFFGVLAGLVITLALFQVFSLPVHVSFTGLIVSFCASIIVGLLGGLYPSQRATAIQPVDTLRS
jgi:putative ABC transport system permease protein